MHQTSSRPLRLAGLALTSAALGVAGLSAPSGAATPEAALKAAPVIVAHIGKHLTLSDNNVRAGQITFRVVSRKGDHELQIVRLRNGYTVAEAGGDFGRAFGGDTAAIRRLDHGVDFRGGAEATPRHPGEVTVSLRAGRYLAFDQNSNSNEPTPLTVHGTNAQRRAPHVSSRIGVFSYGFETARTLPRSGRTLIHNTSDQPHFVVFQRIKESTTRAQVKKTFSSMSEAKPSWALRPSTSSGVISPNRGERFAYDLPAGKYLIACFWPDRDTGMPHAFMGMWRIIHLR